jgi:hypothetical protein
MRRFDERRSAETLEHQSVDVESRDASVATIN